MGLQQRKKISLRKGDTPPTMETPLPLKSQTYRKART